MSVMSLRLPDEMAETLANLAKATGRSKSFLAIDALRDYLAREAWQIAEIQRAIEEADAGDFATDEEVEATFRKWGADAR
ncbi:MULTISPECIES: CopG family ribbon-helix-helix protein [Pseudomonas]|uniref:Ribbon-helix-helix protein, CopG family n=1 Tax=Pseudomonas gingeri TaxID=117681 RepID=A0A7Y7YAW4_9PSED|nr:MULTISPECIES: ribbon-helix-helix protein, CopG family [Pseudomonas]NVZ99987.1 ribbon-helix-helix protein, CopG family [Pseudomonas gingeri]NWA16827.1 ribbon-helix-helix protein, CopG family [Pseudomonas gingeri]NWA53787.1 ribbon-helix-helix protein, CopG family [Pseudomonas gingeri]NWA94019.1 ribbon-helix-helix protein, CopG family [Pseudomonas gingeri]NWB02081.1 ribbon-helix-helix protein, CopG family [Pseudomonas gingeri]